MGKEYVNGEVEKIRWSSCPSSNQEEEELPLLSLNHVSYVCKSLAASVKFYEDVLGFVLVKRPSSFDFEGAWYVLLFPFRSFQNESLIFFTIFIHIFLFGF